MATLKVKDTIELATEFGVSEIQLCYGDITTLPLSEKMDILMVSAFSGDYSPMRGTVIGALLQNLGIDLRDLSYSREMDLRTNFSCWLTHSLPESSPFRRILCFERGRGSRSSLIELIRDIFRVFVPVFRNQESSVITPLLATGHQSCSEVKVLQVMTESAARWILAGLSLKCFKIVVYRPQDNTLCEEFAAMKNVWHKKSQKQVKQLERIYDIFIIFDQEDQREVEVIEEKFKSSSKDLTIYKETPHFDKEKVWQDTLYKKMITAKRIVAILTQTYVNNKDCLEMFNMAVCCNRRQEKKMLFPLYIDTVQALPLYMSVIQFFDCRVRKEGDDKNEKITQAITSILSEDPLAIQNASEKEADSGDDYDVFISYSHKFPAQAVALLEHFEKHHPDIKVFFDRSELTTGSLWQRTLYQSLECSKFIITLITPSYLTSIMCQEEYNISVARYMNESEKMILLPVCVEDIGSVPGIYAKVPMLDGRGDKFEKLIPQIVMAAWSWVKRKKRDLIIPQSPLKPYDFSVCAAERGAELLKEYHINRDHALTRNSPITVSKKAKDTEVVISVSRDKVHWAISIGNLIIKQVPEAKLTLLTNETPKELAKLDEADIVVLLLSKDYMESSAHIEELHMSIIKQRSDMSRRVLYVCQTSDLNPSPIFVHLLHCDVSLTDPIWNDFLKKGLNPSRKIIVSSRAGFEGGFSYEPTEYAAITKLADDIVEGMSSDSKPRNGRIIESMIWSRIATDSEQAKLANSEVPLSECLAGQNNKDKAASTPGKPREENVSQPKEEKVTPSESGTKEVEKANSSNQKPEDKKKLNTSETGENEAKKKNASNDNLENKEKVMTSATGIKETEKVIASNQKSEDKVKVMHFKSETEGTEKVIASYQNNNKSTEEHTSSEVDKPNQGQTEKRSKSCSIL